MSYWLHRISYMWNISKPLFDRNYLTVGWGYMLDSDKVISSVTSNADRNTVREAMNAYQRENGLDELRGNKTRSLEIFAQFRPDDIVVVPLYGGVFNVVRVKSSPKPVTELPKSVIKEISIELSKALSKELSIEVNNYGLYRSDSGDDALGFYVEVEKIRPDIRDIPRSYAISDLQSRMKIRQTNAEIYEKVLQDEIKVVVTRDAPKDVHDVIAEGTAKIILEAIGIYKTAVDVEKLVKWYMRKAGASKVYKPCKPKGKSGEDNDADADVIAEFDPLGVNIYIQVKKHEDKTGSKAVNQITQYKELSGENFADDRTHILWVLSTADGFDDEAKRLAQENSVRLINGTEFARMLVDAGISDINDAGI